MLNMPEYVLIMSQYEWICLNNTEYDWICQCLPEKQSVEYTRIILNVSDPVHSIRSLNLLSSYWDKCIQNTDKNLRSSILQKK